MKNANNDSAIFFLWKLVYGQYLQPFKITVCIDSAMSLNQRRFIYDASDAESWMNYQIPRFYAKVIRYDSP